MELMCEYLHDVILLKMVEEQLGVVRGDNCKEYDNELHKMLGTFRLTSICPTVLLTDG